MSADLLGNSVPTYFSKDKVSEAVASIFFAALFRPRIMFEDLPRAQGYRESAWLMALYMSLPLLMASMLTGIITVIVILPIGLAIGIGTSWLWAWYLAAATRACTGKQILTEDAFHILAYSAPPLAVAWGPYLGPAMALWNLWLNWRGLVSHAHTGKLAALGIIVAGIIFLALIMAVLAWLLHYFLPENVGMLTKTVLVLIQSTRL